MTIVCSALWGLHSLLLYVWHVWSICRHKKTLAFVSTFESFIHGANLASVLILIASLRDQTAAIRAPALYSKRRHFNRALLIALACYSLSFGTAIPLLKRDVNFDFFSPQLHYASFCSVVDNNGSGIRHTFYQSIVRDRWAYANALTDN